MNKGRKHDRTNKYSNNGVRVLQAGNYMKRLIKLQKLMVPGDRFTIITMKTYQTFQVQAVEKGMKGHTNSYWVLPVRGF